MNNIVAKTLSKAGGMCGEPDCFRKVRRFGVIYKISGRGRTTDQGNGPGRWVCAYCAGKYPDPLDYYEEPVF